MPVYNNLKAIRKLSNSSLTSIIDITNLNFKSLSDANLEFLNRIKYDESANSVELNKGTFDFIEIKDTLRLTLDGISTFSIDSLGRAEGQELLVKVAETKRLRLTDFNDWPNIGVPGEIIYTGIQNNRPEFGEDFIGYLQNHGWVSLTGLGQNYVTVNELPGSPPVPPTPGAGQGFIWIGPPGYETSYDPTTQTVYYADENGNNYDLLIDFNWRRLGNDTKFKLSGKVIIGDIEMPRGLQYVDGNQAFGYVLMSDQFGNASWQPNIGSGGSGGACSFVFIANFIADTPFTAIHNLGTDNIQVQLIRTDTNELVDGYIQNYQQNSVDITLTESINGVKIIIIAAGCGGSDIPDLTISQEGTIVEIGVKKIDFTGSAVKVTDSALDEVRVDIPVGLRNLITSGENIVVNADYQYFIYGDLTVSGIINNYGEIVIANGAPILLPGGQINNIGAGIVKQVNLSTGDSIQVVTQTFTTTAFTPITITHNLGTKDFIFSAREGNDLIEIQLTHIDDDSVSIETTVGVIDAVITFHAKI
jgi:hypothetical protein